ncbi:MAG: pyridoxal phosphate-dependent aminotransferase [Ardenticatenaceae bacterium]|nr:pyridoxal phosphate-dependent aminotransferase [Ardenticatenaceae bacterium]HBY98218.1 hypothetical protein [Chloroflexota bacterium]
MRSFVASRVSAAAASAVSEMLHKARQLEAEGQKLVYLMRGEPDFDTPAHIREAAGAALQAGQTHYPPIQGLPELRRAVADRVQRDFGLALDPDVEVLVTTGATMGLYVALMATIEPGDEVLIPDPIYDPYPTIVRMASGVPVRVPTQANSGGHFSATAEVIEAAVTARTKAILINNPWNPTGTVMTREELERLSELARARDLLLIVDEIYEKLVFAGHAHTSLAALSPEARQRTITVNSLSKTYAMTGWRVGYNIAPPSITRAMLRIAEQFSRSASTFVQAAATRALNGPQEPVDHMMQTYARRRELLGRLFRKAGLPVNLPEGTFFLFADIRSFGRSSAELCKHLLQTAHVVTMPGSAYGPGGEGYIRLSFAYDETSLIQGVEAITRGLEQV